MIPASRAGRGAAGSALPLALAVSLLLAVPGTAAAQAAATVAPTDPVNADLERLEAFGLVPRGMSSQRPLSLGRLAWLTREARERWQAGSQDFDPGVRADLHALLARVERRVGGGAGGASGVVEVEAGGGRSPGRWFPDPEGGAVGLVKAVSNPLWAYHGGRSYGDRSTVAVAARADVGGTGAALSLGGRAGKLNGTGALGGRGSRAVEVASARVVVGSVAVDVGRSPVVWGRTQQASLLLSESGVPLDQVRVGSDRPLPVPVLGDLDFTVFVADLGPHQHFPHTKEIGIRVESRPSRQVTLGLSVLNKQGGEGAPEATLRERLWDASVLGPAIFGDAAEEFSDKVLELDLRVVFPSLRSLEVTLGSALTDFERSRIGDILDVAGAYRVGLTLPRLGRSQRHSLTVQGERLGPFLYRHHQFRDGFATESLLQGSPLGPDGRGATLRYGYENPSRGVRLELEGRVEDRRADIYEDRYTPDRDVVLAEDLPDEIRARVGATVALWPGDGATLVRLGAGWERVENPAYPVSGPSRTAFALLAELRYVF